MMAQNDHEKIISKLYKDSLRRQVERPEVQKDKRDFIAAYFKPQPVFMLRPVFFIPAASFIAVLVAVFLLQKPISKVQEIKPREVIEAKKPVEKFHTGKSILGPSEPTVDVKLVTSQVGPTMVYQKNYKDAPITIIWVFMGGNTI